MQKKIIISITLMLVAAAILFTELINIILSFLLTGIVPGTHIVAPYWLMMAVYCTLISLIATPYLERVIKIYYDKRHSIKKPAEPTRRRSIATPN
ncbi:hypothetical protein H7Y29_00930 [Microbacteriaceae bacterium]|nr:hypothetical protein [Candidatus Saccharibacteria bacterium]